MSLLLIDMDGTLGGDWIEQHQEAIIPDLTQVQ
jgi:hypothetical protein